ncbi:S9 family peptidase [Aquihabitans sp. G128]|uniref:S9 family peptidase n=1 Tax=Aquihabitans sp. G128 TaxID=2849779 RepID=UPI001C22FC44|nr:S9 family peptidase [Aquihabitans sp. G128]QXC60148.1 S9 family peptidase [Aquihabitans sp. G128]
MLPSDLGHLIDLGQPALSPDGSLVAFVVRRTDLDANRYRSAVWLAPTDGSRPPRQLTAGTEGDGNPAWSPDGSRLAFTSSREKQGDEQRSTLHVLAIDGPGETVTLTSQPEGLAELRWSPDGTRIAFSCRQRGERYAAGDDDASRPPRKITHLLNRLNGEGFITDRPNRIWAVPADGSGPAVAVSGGDNPGDHASPTWSPDGTRLAFTASSEPDWDLDLRTGVHAVTVGEGVPEEALVPERLVGGPIGWTGLAWSPDGTRIVGLTEDLAVSVSNYRVAVLQVADGSVTYPADALDRSHAPYPGARPPVWDDEHLVFNAEDRGAVKLFRVPADGAAAPEIVLGGAERTVAGFDLAAGVVAYTSTTTDRLAEVHVLDADGTERRLTTLTDGFHRRRPAHPTERFTVASPSEGDLDAWLVTPADLDRSKPHPVLLSIHGGPFTQYGERWFDEFQLWASAGYCVLFTNPHGSSGREQAFGRAIRSPFSAVEPGSGWGGQDADDVLAVLDHALGAFPFLDADRVGVLGGSYGGYLTSWLVGHTDRFAAACSERAVNNLLTCEWSSDAAGLFRWQLGLSHLEGPEEYLRMSPITYVEQITTPMLLLHSEEDLRCPVEQADQLWVALRMLGREVEYHRFPGESHELSRSGSPKHRVQRAQLILDFFDRHLKVGPAAG